MRVPRTSDPVHRGRLHGYRAVSCNSKRSTAINASQDLPEGFPVDEDDFTMEEDIMEEDIELPFEFMEGQVDSSTEVFEFEEVAVEQVY